MTGYPITYGDTLEKGNGFTSETVILGISEYLSDENNLTNFNKGYRFGLLVFSISYLLSSSRAAFASDNTIVPGNGGANGIGSCPEVSSAPSGTPGPGPELGPGPVPIPAKSGSLSSVPTMDRGTYGAGALSICGIAMKSGAYWVGFVCAAAVIVGVRMASVPADCSQ